MRNPEEPQNGQLGRHLLDQLSEQLNKQVKDRQESEGNENHKTGGFVSGFSNEFNDKLDSHHDSVIFKRNKQFSSQDLQLLLLTLLTEKPAHGVELVKAFEAHSNGSYSPSPEIIYPTLTHLNELGYIIAALNNDRQYYSLSAAGTQYLTDHQERADALWVKLNKRGSQRRAYLDWDEFEADINAVWLPELIEAKRTLGRALIQCGHAPAIEQRRITEVLLQAARTIATIAEN